jgi:hypothetical protein
MPAGHRGKAEEAALKSIGVMKRSGELVGMDSNTQAIAGFVIEFSPVSTQRRQAANHLIISSQIISR